MALLLAGMTDAAGELDLPITCRRRPSLTAHSGRIGACVHDRPRRRGDQRVWSVRCHQRSVSHGKTAAIATTPA